MQAGISLVSKGQGLRRLHIVVVSLAHLRLWALANLTMMVVEAARSSEVIELIFNILLTGLHALFGKFLLGCYLNARCLGQGHVIVSLRLLNIILHLLLILVGNTSILALFELKQALGLFREHSDLLLDIAIGL